MTTIIPFPTIEAEANIRVTDRKDINYYSFRIPDEAFLALLEALAEWQTDHPGPYTTAQKTFLQLFQKLKFPLEALLVRQARALLLASDKEIVYICPHCRHHRLDNVLRMTGECKSCQATVMLEDAFKVIPQMSTESVLAYLKSEAT